MKKFIFIFIVGLLLFSCNCKQNNKPPQESARCEISHLSEKNDYSSVIESVYALTETKTLFGSSHVENLILPKIDSSGIFSKEFSYHTRVPLEGKIYKQIPNDSLYYLKSEVYNKNSVTNSINTAEVDTKADMVVPLDFELDITLYNKTFVTNFTNSAVVGAKADMVVPLVGDIKLI